MYFNCVKCGGSFGIEHRWCPLCDQVMVEHTEALRASTADKERIAELEAENKTLRAAQKACEYCDETMFNESKAIRAERDALKAALNVDVLAVHSGRTMTREWASAGAWLYPGDKIVLSYRIDAAKGK